MNFDAPLHVTGRSIYTDDMPALEGTVYIRVFDSPVAHGVIRDIDYSSAEKSEGVIRVYSYRDIPGENQIGGIVPDEELLASHEVHYCGQPVLLVVADSDEAAGEAVNKIHITIDPLPVITDPREAFKKGMLLSPSRKFIKGNTGEAFKHCKYVYEGRTETNGQEHLYLETQGAYCV